MLSNTPAKLTMAAALALAGACVSAESDTPGESTNEEARVERGEYLFALGGCASCHTDSEGGGQALAGGVKLETPFGTFYTPNISPDPTYGIGSWTDDDFVIAMKQGLSPTGEHYYPSFPYTSYTKMTDRDVLDLKGYLDAQPPVAVPSRAHELPFPISERALLTFWKWLNFDGSGFRSDPGKSEAWNRGAYIVNGPGHCVECHMPRNLTGGLDREAGMIGNVDGPEGETVPGLVASGDGDFGSWDSADIVFLLEAGMKPDGDFVSGAMGHVVEKTTSLLTPDDRRAIAEYLKSQQH